MNELSVSDIVGLDESFQSLKGELSGMNVKNSVESDLTETPGKREDEKAKTVNRKRASVDDVEDLR